MKKIGLLLFIVTVLLSLLGLFMLYESSSYSAILQLDDKYFFVRRQTIFFSIGLVIAFLISRVNPESFYKIAVPLLLGTIALLIIVLIPGIGLELKGARRWIDLGFIVLQPSELLKVSLTIYFAAWLSKEKDKGVFPFFIILAVTAGLVAIEPDLGTSLIIAGTAVIMYFISNAPLKQLSTILIIGILAVISLILIEPYRMARLTAFTRVSVENLDNTSYHTKQILIALGSGGFSGVGFGNSVQKYAYLPENTTDSIFAIFAEEAGFIGSVFLILLYSAQTYLGFVIASKAKSKFLRLLASGITAYLAIQTFLNIGSQVILVPITGAPLPFISYGGSSMIINFVAIGILLAIARKQK